MNGIDIKIEFTPVNVAVLTVTDTRTAANDTSGDLLVQKAKAAGHVLTARAIVPDEILAIRKIIGVWINHPDIDVIVTTGGTGLTGRDVTPEAVHPLFDKEIAGFSTVFHMVSFQTVGLSTLQSRAIAGLSNGTFIFCLPGSNGGVRDGWDKVISHQIDSRYKPCNFVPLMSHLKARKIC